ncbi:MAG: urease accessory protein UreE [Phormidesmis priestleyi Ana]|uniref:Urease accessory protein UreE n=1 Tax=Phormidesmis priestleyi Ana TaxID=1666911 RepID=A0A0P7ZKP6_9CYAN|nr:MAG: urease accessory protein UreE [Phormidesmis priestleyi Ana]
MPETELASTKPTPDLLTELAEDYLGNVSESADVARRVVAAQRENRCLEVLISKGDRAKGRILTRAKSGQLVGIVKSRSWLLKDGDVLSTAQNNLVLVSLQEQQVMALRFATEESTAAMAGRKDYAIALMHLGHTLGNQHWPVSVKGETMYVEIVTDFAQMQSTLSKMVETLGIKGLHISIETKSADSSVEFTTDHAH